MIDFLLIIVAIIIAYFVLIYRNVNIKSNATTPACPAYPKPLIAQQGEVTLVDSDSSSNSDTNYTRRTTVTFNTAFAAPPVIHLSVVHFSKPESTTFYNIFSTNITRTSFRVNAAVNGKEMGDDLNKLKISWIAIGTPA